MVSLRKVSFSYFLTYLRCISATQGLFTIDGMLLDAPGDLSQHHVWLSRSKSKVSVLQWKVEHFRGG